MTRNISIREFVNSFDGKDSLFPNTLRYLYNADFQNGLYIDKSPTGSGSSTLIYLLTLYRIAKYLTFNNSKEIGFINVYDTNPQLFLSTLNSVLEDHKLFLKAENPREESEMDRRHIYYREHGKFAGGASTRIRFWFDGKPFEFYINKLDGVFTGRMETTGAQYDIRYCLGVILNVSLGYLKDDATQEIVKGWVKGWFTNTIAEGKYKHGNLRLDPIGAAKQPFTIVSKETLMTCDLDPIEFDNESVIEINDLPFNKSFRDEAILKETFYTSQQIQGGSFGSFVATDAIVDKTDLTDAVYEEVYGLYPKWDYNRQKNIELKTDFGFEVGHNAALKTPIKDKLEDYPYEGTDFDRMIKEDEAFATLIAAQVKYMRLTLKGKTKVEKNKLFSRMSDAFDYKFTEEGDVLKYITDVYKFIKENKIPVSVAQHAKAFNGVANSSGPLYLPGVYFNKKDLPNYVGFDNGSELVILIPIVFEDPKNSHNEFVIYGDWRQNPYQDILKV